MACDELNISRSTISHHFNALKNTGLIPCVRNDPTVESRVNGEALKEIRGFPTWIFLQVNCSTVGEL
jgi:DNA-binding transcriptional ArsR family regulator